MRKLIIAFIVLLVSLFIIVFSQVEMKVMYAPSIEKVKKVMGLGDDEFLIVGDTKSFTETSDDWFILKANSKRDILKFSILSGAFSDKLVDFNNVNSYFVGIGDTWSFRRESLDDILVGVFDKDLNLVKYYVVSGTRDDRASKIISVRNGTYFLGSTRSVGFGAESNLIYKFGPDFYPTNFWVVGSSVDQTPFDLIEISPSKYLLVSSYQKLSGNKDCLLAVVDDNFNVSRAFAFGGGFDEEITDIIQTKDNFYFIFNTRSFKPQDKSNILISSFKKSNLNYVRSFAFGTLEDDFYLSSYQYDDNIFVFFSTMIDKKPALAVAILDYNLALKATYVINDLFGIDSKVSGFFPLKENLFAVNIFNLNTLDDISIFSSKNIFDYLLQDYKKISKNVQNLRVEKYYLKVAKYPNIESYPVELKSESISPDNFVITDQIKLNYTDINYQDIWK